MREKASKAVSWAVPGALIEDTGKTRAWRKQRVYVVGNGWSGKCGFNQAYGVASVIDGKSEAWESHALEEML